MVIKKLLLTAVWLFSSLLGFSQYVTNPSELNSAINSATPGATIVLADGTWKDTFIDIDKNGTSSAPITITAQNAGAVFMTGNSRVYMEGSYLTVSGLVFQDPENLDVSGSNIKPIFELKQCNYCRVLNNQIDSYNGSESQKDLTFKWILTDGQYNEIAYNSFLGKYGIGSIINDNRNSTEEDFLKIHHNYFADRTPVNEVNEDNDQDAIRIGNSGSSLHSSFTEVYNNYFHNFFGEVEVISNKSGDNKYYNNTFRDYSGTLTLRHGDNCEVYGNYFFAEGNTFSGGIRVIGEGHKIYNNYIEGVNSTKPDGSTSNATGGINISNGRLNSALNGYYQVKDARIVNNTFVNCDYAVRVGTKVSSDLDQAPENLIVANNIMYNSSIDAYQVITSPLGASLSEGNMTDIPENDLIDDGKFHRLSEGGLPVDAGVGHYNFLTFDVLGASRDVAFDVGAEEYGAGGTNFPYDEQYVGVNVGFGAISDPTLGLVPTTLNFGVHGGNVTFEVIANVGWTITEDISWLSFDVSSGSGRTFVTATADENTTGTQRDGTIFFNEVAGGSDLSTMLSAIQSNTFIPSEIPIIGTTSEGMQDKEGIHEENAYNDDTSNYWTGDPDTEPEVSITFDLSCVHELTEIGINFWKAEERTTTFSIAVANEATGPFITILDNAISSDNNVSVDTEQIFSLNGASGRYVKFIGIGNSSSTNWTSIANVNIYGDVNCKGNSGVPEVAAEKVIFSLYPVPVSNGFLTIATTSKTIGLVDIYNVFGQLVLRSDGGNLYTKKLNLSNLNSGVYFIVLEGIGVSNFVIE